MSHMSEEPQNPRIESSKRKISDALELHQHMRGMIGLNPFNILQRIKGGLQNFKAQQAQQVQAQQCNTSGAAGCSTAPQTVPTQGAQTQYTPRNGLLGFGLLRSQPQPQQPVPLSPEQKKEIAEQEKLKELEDKKKLAREKQYRLDHLRGISVDRT